MASDSQGESYNVPNFRLVRLSYVPFLCLSLDLLAPLNQDHPDPLLLLRS